MHWTEVAIDVAAIVLLVLFAIPVLLLLGMVGLIVWGVLTEAFQKRSETVRVQTPLGEFTRQGHERDGFTWEGEAEAGGKELQVLVKDVGGSPNPELLALIPQIGQDLSALEAEARRTVPNLSERHQLSFITDTSDEGVDFILGFSYEEEVWGETVFVDFRGQEVVNWSAVD